MKVLNLVQGTPEWHAHRATHFNASDAPAMMGVSNYTSRTKLLHRLATGDVEEVTPAVQALFDRGHAAEAAVRPHIEALLCEDLYPIIAESDDHPKLSASFDGLNLAGRIGMEVKLWNEAIVQQVRAGELTDPHYYTQLEQHFLVNDALEKIIFVVSRDDASEYVWMEYRPVAGRREAILAGWAQFEKDLAAYVPEVQPAAKVGRAPESLPALRVEVTGMVKASNLTEFRDHAMTVFRSINRDLQSDQDFADAEKTVKWCSEMEARLKAAKEAVLAQTSDIEAVFRAIDDISAAARTARLDLDNLVKNRKEAIREEIVKAAAKGLADHVTAVNQRLGKYSLPTLPADIRNAIKGKKTVASLKDAANNEVVRVKIEADRWAALIEENAALLAEKAVNHLFLFADANDLVRKDPDAVDAIIAKRISEHEDAQRRKAEAAAEAERVRIRNEEQEKLRLEEETKNSGAATAESAVQQQPRLLADTVGQTAANVEVATDGRMTVAAAPALSPAQARAVETLKTAVASQVTRPADDQIIHVLALHYRVHESKVIEWLLDIDLITAGNRMAKAI